jgi:hypothetical protein
MVRTKMFLVEGERAEEDRTTGGHGMHFQSDLTTDQTDKDINAFAFIRVHPCDPWLKFFAKTSEIKMTPPSTWPALPLDAWKDTYATLHRWTQIVGKVRLARMPWINHSWHVTLYVTSRGLTTGPIPDGNRSFQIDFDFLAHKLLINASDGQSRSLELRPRSVADFCREFLHDLRNLGIAVKILGHPCELEDATPFAEDETHASYDADAAQRCWQAFVQVERVLTKFRSRFIGKCSPVHFFWGAFDLAVTRFSGRTAPQHPGGVPNLADWVAREAYSHEVSSAGFWPGSGPIAYPAFYSYAYPEPEGFRDAPVRPAAAFYSSDLREFVLPYDAVRESPTPDEMLLEFLQSTYEAAANLAKWDRAGLERQ